LLAGLLADSRYDSLFDLAAEAADRFLETHAEAIRQRATRKGTSWIPGWIDARLAKSALAELQDGLAAARTDPGHPWRAEGRKAVEALIAHLADDPDLIALCERLKQNALDGDMIDRGLDWLAGRMRPALDAEPSARAANPLVKALPALGDWLAGDPIAREQVNASTRRLLGALLARGRAPIGAFAAQSVARWETKTLIERLEAQVGKDLQYIRINGTLVGGLVGLLLYVLSRGKG